MKKPLPTLVYTDRCFEDHNTGPGHPENAGRLQAVRRILPAGTNTPPVPGPESFPRADGVHSTAQIQLVRQLTKQGGGSIDPDTVVSPASWDVARRAAATCTDAVERILDGQARNALCLIRPPGHHATDQQSMGFCLFNNIALAAQTVLQRQAGPCLIVDWDVHHGNGTQDIFYNRDDVFYYSVHRYPFYPGTGHSSETGTGPGLGYTLNVPLPAATSSREYVDAFRAGLEKAAARIKPGFLLISAGFDAHRLDPVGSLGLGSEDFYLLTRMVIEVADLYCGGRLVSCLEGGYEPAALARSVGAHLRALEDQTPG